jgi:cell division protein FtsW (lipid II flippase)
VAAAADIHIQQVKTEKMAALAAAVQVQIPQVVLAEQVHQVKEMLAETVVAALLMAVVGVAVVAVLAQTRRGTTLAMAVQRLPVQFLEHLPTMLVVVALVLHMEVVLVLLVLAAVQQPQHKKAVHQTAQTISPQETHLTQQQTLAAVLVVVAAVAQQTTAALAVQVS